MSSVMVSKETKLERVPQSIIESLLASVSIVDLLKESTSTKLINGVNHSPCPFHVQGDAEYSLSIDENNQTFSCSECNFRGSAIGWLMYHDGLTFQDALLVLADRGSYDLTQWIDTVDIESARQAKYLFQHEVVDYFQSELAQSEAALSYIATRGLSEDVVKLFELGFSPQNAKCLIDAFPKKERQLWNSGHLIRLADKQYSNRFRDRLMFPIKNVDGLVVGFGGRTFGDHKPKYLNSPGSPTFKKSSILYGLHESLSAIRSSEVIDSLYLVEGYMDVLALHDAGHRCAVATLGTAPSTDHLETIFSYTNNLTACFDGDTAGRKAAMRLLELALPIITDSNNIQFIELPEGEDPDSLIKKYGSRAITELPKRSIHEYLIQHLLEGLDLESIGGKSALYAKAAQYVSNTLSKSIKSALCNEVELIIGIDWESMSAS